MQYSKMEKPPEKYSLEWYMLQKPPPKEQTDKPANVGLVCVSLYVSLYVSPYVCPCMCPYMYPLMCVLQTDKPANVGLVLFCCICIIQHIHTDTESQDRHTRSPMLAWF